MEGRSLCVGTVVCHDAPFSQRRRLTSWPNSSFASRRIRYHCDLAMAAHLEPHFPGRAPLPNRPTRVMNLLRPLERSFPCPVSSAPCSSPPSSLSVAVDTPPTNRKPNATSNAMPKALASMTQRTTNASRVTKRVAQIVPWRNLARFNTSVQNDEQLLNNG